jgi:hypothetical protein
MVQRFVDIRQSQLGCPHYFTIDSKMKHQFALTVLFASYLASGHAEDRIRRRRLVQQETWTAGESLKEDEPYWSRLLEGMSMSATPDKGDDDDDDGDSIPVPSPKASPTASPTASPVDSDKPVLGGDDNTLSPSPPAASPNGDTSSPTDSPDEGNAPVTATISNDSPVSSP